MSVHRVMGIETEYGVLCPSAPQISPMVLSGEVVTAYAAPQQPRARWDFVAESPLADARGFQMSRQQAHPSQLTDVEGGPGGDELADLTTANAVLTNGARLYVDHAHPEYSSPEVIGPLDGVLYDKAGEQVMATAVTRLAQIPGGHPVNLYKNNTDNKGSAYGTHENYLMSRATPFASIVTGLIPFFVTRQVFAGSGKVGLGRHGEQPGYQLSQRADFFEAEVGLETTLRRPIVNTRDEPHASADLYRRLHVIIGDANLCEVATFLKLGTTALVLGLIEAGECPDLVLADPVAELVKVSHDPQLTYLLTLADGRTMTAVQVQWEYLWAAQRYVERRCEPDPGGQTASVLGRWADVLDRLERDPMSCARELDWVAKLRLLNGFREREHLAWGAPRLEQIDVQYSDVRPERGLYRRLERAGAVERLCSPEQVERAVAEPPEHTRAYFRGECLRRFPDQIRAVSWDSLVFDLPGHATLQRVPMMDPLRGTREHVEPLLRRARDAQELLQLLGGG